MKNVIDLVARIFLAQIFVLAGISKIGGYVATQGYMESMGVPGMLLPLVIALEIGGGLALIIGFQTQLAALALAGFSIIAAAIFHHDFANQMQSIMFMKDIAMSGGLLLLVVHGAGELSIDKVRAKR
jgi:putative oxidoreductase